MAQNSEQEHEIRLKGRKLVEVTGVASVESFDVQEFVLTTSGGPLRITGSDLNMKHLDLDKGEVFIEGTLISLAYVQDQGKKKSSIKKLFR
ncbi:sporulation protein YabP [Alicyclobacillus sp. SO9]|uniref:sporulation protein YabP n=1 Tax=Alicyclobacillus sp. SO9 TaxID=2665646 RepID=UPI0018E854AB|nr:sporulation protein YabP [Alicyclobacillus sp. SO9]QQE79415.1 sporulation protein YabP [Alicyclobacillus sp. SO9]